ncbi:MAG: T9SS type A sorting domain-containing protein, partial [Bacteroidia bacterium]
NLYIADQTNHRIRKVTLSTTSVPDANFKANNKIVCAGSTVTFLDSTTNALVTSYQWSFPGGNLVSGYTLTDASPKVIYNTPGMYAVTYTASNSSGQASITKTAYINVQIAAATYNTAISEGFETTTVPGTDWSVSNSATSNWMLTSAAAATGLKSLMINNLTNSTNNVSTIVGPTFNLSAINSPVLSFDMSYKQITTTNTDKLQVLVSTDCGGNWLPKWTRSGTALQPASVIGQSASPFTPSAAEFTTYTVNISSAALSTNAMFKWVFTAGASSVGNNIYLDNINIYDATSLGIKNINEDKTFSIYPNPTNASFTIETNTSVKQTLQIVDVNGRIVLTQTINGTSTINTGNLAEGVYNASLMGDEGIINKKLVIVR